MPHILYGQTKSPTHGGPKMSLTILSQDKEIWNRILSLTLKNCTETQICSRGMQMPHTGMSMTIGQHPDMFSWLEGVQLPG
jgi:hypothetical protein